MRISRLTQICFCLALMVVQVTLNYIAVLFNGVTPEPGRACHPSLSSTAINEQIKCLTL